MRKQQKTRIQSLVICGLLMLSCFTACDGKKTNSKSKSSSSSSSSSRRTNQPVSQPNPGSLSYSGISPSSAQAVKPKPSAPVQSAPAQQKPFYNNNNAPAPYPNQPGNHAPPPGWNVNNNNQRPPYPQQGPPPPGYSQYPQQHGPPPAYAPPGHQAPAPNFK